MTCSKFYGMGGFGAYFTHAQRWENLRVQRATEISSASVHNLHMPKALTTFVFICHSATQWTASVHTLYTCPKHPKAVKTFVFKVLRNGLLRCKTRQLENENTFCRFRVVAFPSFCAFPISVRV